MIKLLLVVILSVFGGAHSSAVALDFFNEKANTAYNKGDYKTAYEIWQPQAENGDAVAQLKMGVRYFDGNGVRKNYSEAIRWYKLSADQGNVKAQIFLGSMYHTGMTGIPQNQVEGLKWFNLAASTGDVTGRSLKETSEREMTPQQIAEAKKLTQEWVQANKK